MRRLGEEGNAAVVGLIVGIGIFTSIYATLIDTTIHETDPIDPNTSRNYNSVAQMLAGQILDPGRDWFLGSESIRCVGGRENPAALTPDAVGRLDAGEYPGQFGLGEESCSGVTDGNHGAWLSYAKIADLFNAQMDPATNGHVDYEEARRSLDLNSRNLGFHIRAVPILDEVEVLLTAAATTPTWRAAYIGDFWQDSTASTARMVANRSGVEDGATNAIAWVNITNNGTTSTAFEVNLTLKLSRGDILLSHHTPLLAPGQYHNVTTTLPKTRDWAWSTAAGSSQPVFTIKDVDGQVGSGRLDFSGVDMSDSLQPHPLLLVRSYPGWVPVSTATSITYEAFRGDGSATSSRDWKLRIFDPTGVAVGSTIVPSPSARSGTVTSTPAVTGSYEVRLEDDAFAVRWDRDSFTSHLGSLLPFTPAAFVGASHPQDAVVPEVALVDAVINTFDISVYDALYQSGEMAFAADGDVYPDLTAAMRDGLAPRLIDDWGTPSPSDDVGSLDEYNVLIVGSNVDHDQLSAEAFMRAIDLWVAEGGTLIVFGSAEQDFDWLETLAGSGIVTANGPLYAVDENHPVLSTPNDLDYEAYQDFDMGWSLNSDAERFFTHVLRTGPNVGDVDLLAVSNGGSFGMGRVVLSAYQPHDLTADQATHCTAPLSAATDCEAIKFLRNVLTQSFRQLMLDYGPPIPEDQPTGAAHRVVLIDHPDLGDPVAVRLAVYVFPSG